jgi:hypothetical protein
MPATEFNAQYPTAKLQLAYVQAPFRASEDNGQG